MVASKLAYHTEFVKVLSGDNLSLLSCRQSPNSVHQNGYIV